MLSFYLIQGTQTDDKVTGYGQIIGEPSNVLGIRNSRNRLTASSGTEVPVQLRPRSADGRFIFSEPNLEVALEPRKVPAYDIPDSYKTEQEEPYVAKNTDELTTDKLIKVNEIPVINMMAPPSTPPYQEKIANGITFKNGPMDSPVLNIDDDLDSDSKSTSSDNSSLHISEDFNSVGGSIPASPDRGGILNNNGVHALNNYNNRNYSSDSTNSSPPSSQSNYSVRHVAPPNGEVKNIWDAGDSPVAFFPVLSQSDPALSSGRDNPDSFYRAHINEDQFPIVM